MTVDPDHRSLRPPHALSQADVSALLATAQLLRNARRAGRAQPLLRGKNLALLHDSPPADGTADPFDLAATELGARVSHLELARGDLPHTARLLGRLYDAIECGDLPADVTRELERHAGVPVFNGLAGHASLEIARMMSGPDAGPEEVAENLHYVLQAMLVDSLT